MDTVGTFEVAKELAALHMLTAVHKHYDVDQWREFVRSNPECVDYVAVSSGTSEDDFKKLSAVLFSFCDFVEDGLDSGDCSGQDDLSRCSQWVL